jgi:hypothetical protein
MIGFEQLVRCRARVCQITAHVVETEAQTQLLYQDTLSPSLRADDFRDSA